MKYFLNIISIAILIVISSSFSFPDYEEERGDIILEITGFRNNVGQVRVGLYNENDDFLKTPSLSLNQGISDNKCRIVIRDQVYGKYAVGLLHDENDNNKMDYNWAKIPKEGYGISRNPKVYFSAPTFDDARFILNDKSLVVKIEMKYF